MVWSIYKTVAPFIRQVICWPVHRKRQTWPFKRIEDLRKATEDFSSNSHIDGSVFHGCLNGKNLAIKRIKTKMVSKLDLGLFNDANHHHPDIINLLGTEQVFQKGH
ncbi:protein LYK2 [Trifolium repens]|nr:protein LYK2 [Trifolium repens]